MKESNIKKKTFSGLIWMFMERIGAQAVSFVVSIVLARLLLPEEYGVISIVLVFINICNVFVNSGFGKALVQKKDVDELDFSSIFYFSFTLSIAIYIVLFFTAPFIANFYNMEILIPVLRVMGIRIIIASFNSVQHAKVTKELKFKRFFFSTIGGTIISAVVGIVLAYQGFGVWALVAQYTTNTVVDTVILFFTVKWRPKFIFSFKRVKVLFNFGWKVLLGSLVDTLYEEFRNLYIGKLYSASDLAYYSRGHHFVNLIVNNINASVSSVLFPVISKVQDSKESVRNITRRAIRTNAYILTPMLLGFAVVAEPVIKILLTDKWLPSVPYIQILCFNGALIPLHSANIQAIYAVGRSDIALKLNIFKKTVGFIFIVVFAQISVLAMTYAGVITGVVCLVANALPNKKLFNYGIKEQFKDVIPFWLMSLVMAICVWGVSLIFDDNIYIELIIKVFVGIIVYLLQSIIFKVESFTYIVNNIKLIITKKV